MKSSTKKTAAGLLIITLLSPVFYFYPKKVEAQLAVPIDAVAAGLLATTQAQIVLGTTQTAIATGALASKEVGAVPGVAAYVSPGQAALTAPTSHNFIATQIANRILRQITDAAVVWIDSGFQGSPAFVSNPTQFFGDIADSVAGDFIEGSALGFMCQPFQLDLRLALAYRYNSSFERDNSCRLSDVLNNLENFTDFTAGRNFHAGGWDGWFQVIQPRNNPYGSYLAAEAELAARISGAQNIELLQLNWGSGFLSLTDDDGNIITPGAAIESSLADVLGTEIRQLELADSFDRVLQALLNQLITSVLSGKGLRGAAQDRTERKLPPLPPDNVEVLGVFPTQINVGWDPSFVAQGSVTGYNIWRDKVDPSDPEKIEKIATIDDTFYADGGLGFGVTYTYQISAFSSAGESDLSEPISATTSL